MAVTCLAFKGLSKTQDAIFSMYHIFVSLCKYDLVIALHMPNVGFFLNSKNV